MCDTQRREEAGDNRGGDSGSVWFPHRKKTQKAISLNFLKVTKPFHHTGFIFLFCFASSSHMTHLSCAHHLIPIFVLALIFSPRYVRGSEDYFVSISASTFPVSSSVSVKWIAPEGHLSEDQIEWLWADSERSLTLIVNVSVGSTELSGMTTFSGFTFTKNLKKKELFEESFFSGS